LVISDSTFAMSGNSDGASGAGIQIAPLGSGSAQVTLQRVNVSGNVFGVAADGNSSTGGINMTIADSVLASNKADGLVATTLAGHAPIGVTVANTTAANNNIGFRAIGPNVTVRLEHSRAIGNGTGLAAIGGGVLLSAGNNVVQANGSNGAFTGAVPLN
jgi:hypothetical protein